MSGNTQKLGKYSPDQLKQLEKEGSKLGKSGKELGKWVDAKVQEATGGKSLGHASGKSGSGQNSKTTGMLKNLKKK